MEESFHKTAIPLFIVLTLSTLLSTPTPAYSNGGAPDGIGDS